MEQQKSTQDRTLSTPRGSANGPSSPRERAYGHAMHTSRRAGRQESPLASPKRESLSPTRKESPLTKTETSTIDTFNRKPVKPKSPRAPSGRGTNAFSSDARWEFLEEHDVGPENPAAESPTKPDRSKRSSNRPSQFHVSSPDAQSPRSPTKAARPTGRSPTKSRPSFLVAPPKTPPPPPSMQPSEPLSEPLDFLSYMLGGGEFFCVPCSQRTASVWESAEQVANRSTKTNAAWALLQKR
jgi:hypothetical protein